MARRVLALLALSAVVVNVTIGCSSGLHCALMHRDDPHAVLAHLGGHHSNESHESGHDPDSDHHPGDHWQFVAKLPQAESSPQWLPAANGLAAIADPAAPAICPQVASVDRPTLLPAADLPIMHRALLL